MNQWSIKSKKNINIQRRFNLQEINVTGFSRNGTTTLRETLKASFLDYKIGFGHETYDLKKPNVIIPIRNPQDSIRSVVEFNLQRLVRDTGLDINIPWEISNSIFSYCVFFKKILENKENIFVISFEDLISNPNPKLIEFSKKFNLADPLSVDINEIIKSVPSGHLPKHLFYKSEIDSCPRECFCLAHDHKGLLTIEIREEIKEIIKNNKQIHKAIELYENAVTLTK